MNFILRTAPPFLRKADAYLRINHSWIWTTRIQIHLYLGLILGLVFSIVGLLYSIDLTDVPGSNSQNTFYMILFVPATAFCIYMLYNMSLFNTDKSHAYRFKYQEFFLFLIFFFTFCLPLLIIYPASMILNARIANLVEDDQFETDKEQLNRGLVFFPVSKYEYDYYPSDSLYIYETITHPVNNDNEYNAPHLQRRENMKELIFTHSGEFEKSRPKLYYHHSRDWTNTYSYGRYRRNSMRHHDFNAKAAERVSIQDSLYRMYIDSVNIYHDPEVAKRHISEMHLLLKKYNGNYDVDKQRILNNFMTNYYKPGDQRLEIALQTVKDNVTAIYYAKNKYVSAWNLDVFRSLLIFAFCFTLLFQVFKNVHWKQLLLALGIAACLLTLVIIVEVISRFRGEFFALTGVILPFLLLALSVAGFRIKKFHWIFNQANIYLTWLLPFYPLIILAYLANYHQFFGMDYFDRYKVEITNQYGRKDWIYSDAYYILVSKIWHYTFWAGILSYVFLWNSFLKLLYLRYWSLPKNR